MKDMKEKQRSKNSRYVRNITFCGVMTALAMIFSYIESLIPIPIPIWGIKLGVANIAVIAVLYVAGEKEAFGINVIRITLTAILFGNLNSFWFSIAGGLLSIMVMILLKKSGLFSMVGVSVAGGVAHNIGQIAAAVILMETTVIAYYLPVLLIAGVITGIIVGVTGAVVTKHILPAYEKTL